jgi:PTH1 family peptidyl-tRNA hydrolase
MSVIVGLGNPGADYEETRHNIGFMVVKEIARRRGIEWKYQKTCRADVAKQGDSYLMKPQTYMNQSGQAVRAVLEYFKQPIGSLLVISDDVDLPFGELRLRDSGSSGGHNGLGDIIATLKTEEFTRLRIGVGRGPGSTTDHVLGRFTDHELGELPAVIDAAIIQIEAASE